MAHLQTTLVEASCLCSSSFSMPVCPLCFRGIYSVPASAFSCRHCHVAVHSLCLVNACLLHKCPACGCPDSLKKSFFVEPSGSEGFLAITTAALGPASSDISPLGMPTLSRTLPHCGASMSPVPPTPPVPSSPFRAQKRQCTTGLSLGEGKTGVRDTRARRPIAPNGASLPRPTEPTRPVAHSPREKFYPRTTTGRTGRCGYGSDGGFVASSDDPSSGGGPSCSGSGDSSYEDSAAATDSDLLADDGASSDDGCL